MKKLVMICLINVVVYAADQKEQKNYQLPLINASDYVVSSMGAVQTLSDWMREQKKNIHKEREATDIKCKELNAKLLAQMERLATTMTQSVELLDKRLLGLENGLSALGKRVDDLERLVLHDRSSL